MHYLQLNQSFKWQIIVRKIALPILLIVPLLSISHRATAGPFSNSKSVYSLPLTIQAEKYAAMKGVKAIKTTDTHGGLAVGWTDTQDWISYASTKVKIPTSGKYKIIYRVASENGRGSFIFRETNNGTAYDKVVVPRTGNWQSWVNVSRTVTLNAGVHTFGIEVITGGFNLNWFKIESMDSVSSSSSSSLSSKRASSKAAPPTSTKSSSKAGNSSSASNSKVTSVDIIGPVEINWMAPKSRENGKYLDITELAGYQLRYKLTSAASFTYVTINSAWTNFYSFNWLEGNYIFQIAAFDKNGQYSDFVNILEK